MTTYCLGPFALRLSRLPLDREKWKAELERQPETCGRGCKSHHGQPYACREVCRSYAHVQWNCARTKV